MPEPAKSRKHFTETMNRVRGMLVHYWTLAPDRDLVQTTLRELDDVEALIAECYAAREGRETNEKGG